MQPHAQLHLKHSKDNIFYFTPVKALIFHTNELRCEVGNQNEGNGEGGEWGKQWGGRPKEGKPRAMPEAFRSNPPIKSVGTT
jgi:hypothetical protein